MVDMDSILEEATSLEKKPVKRQRKKKTKQVVQATKKVVAINSAKGDVAAQDDDVPTDEQLTQKYTTNLLPETYGRLQRFCFERKLNKERPFTQQIITDLAIQAYLEKHGY